MRIRKNVKLFTKQFTKRNKNVIQLTLRNAVMIIMAPAMVEEVNAIIMEILNTLKKQSNVRKSHIKIVNMSMFPHKCLTNNVTMSKFPYNPMYLTKNVIMLRCPNATKFQRKSATKALTNHEGGTAAAIVPALMDPAM